MVTKYLLVGFGFGFGFGCECDTLPHSNRSHHLLKACVLLSTMMEFANTLPFDEVFLSLHLHVATVVIERRISSKNMEYQIPAMQFLK